MKQWYSAQELINLRLSVLPKSKSNLIARAKKQGWPSRKRAGKGGGLEYEVAALPKPVQDAIKAKQMQALLPKRRKDVAKTDDYCVTDHLDQAQRRAADARMMMVTLVSRLQDEDNLLRSDAIAYISKLSRHLALPTIDGVDYNAVCDIATAKSNRKKGVGARVLHDWVLIADRCQNGADVLSKLSPKKQGRKKLNVMALDWMGHFLSIYRTPKGLSVTRAYEDFAFEYSKIHGKEAVPSLAQVRTAFNRLPTLVQNKGRVTGSKFKQLQSYVRRNWNADWMNANDVWVGDGHAMKLKVRHPLHGQEFMPEITIIMDAVSRYVVGWSLALSESHFAVADALRHAMIQNGVPAVYYSDNGPGQCNDILDNPLTGILPRIGIEHATGIPGNPQARGIIERFMKEVPNRVAQRFDTYFGKSADSDTVRKNLYAVASYSNAIAKGKSSDALSKIQARGSQILPTWQELIEAITEEVYRYNHFHHHRSIGTTPAKKRAQLIEKMAQNGASITPLSEDEARDLFCPSFERKVIRGRVSFASVMYGDESLEFYDGKKVMVGVDIHNAATVQVRTLDGMFICTAKADYRSCDAFAKSFVERAKDRRQKGVTRRAQAKIDKIRAESKRTIDADFSALSGNSTAALSPRTTPAEFADFVNTNTAQLLHHAHDAHNGDDGAYRTHDDTMHDDYASFADFSTDGDNDYSDNDGDFNTVEDGEDAHHDTDNYADNDANDYANDYAASYANDDTEDYAASYGANYAANYANDYANDYTAHYSTYSATYAAPKAHAQKASASCANAPAASRVENHDVYNIGDHDSTPLTKTQAKNAAFAQNFYDAADDDFILFEHQTKEPS